MNRVHLLTTAMLAATAAGCTGPTVSFRHVLPPDLPVPAGAKGTGSFSPFENVPVPVVRVKAFEGDHPDAVEHGLRRRLADGGPWRVAAKDAPADLVVGGRVDVQTKENAGTRVIAGGPALSRATAPPGKAVPTLVRSASMTVVFSVSDGAGKRIADVEARRRYVSTDDARVRGPDGLERPDEPANVPPMEKILAEQADGCAAVLCRMIAPAVVEVEVVLRRAGPKAAFSAAERGDWATAYAAFAEAAARRPRDADLQFNLAVAEEATGRLAEAVARYDRLAERDDDLGRTGAEAARRVRLVIERQGRANSTLTPITNDE